MTATGAPPAVIRVAGSAADWAAIRSLCCRTGNRGEPIDPSRWPLFAELWIGPYQRIVPRWTFVAEVEGRVAGYLTGCPDTAEFRRARRLRATLPVLIGIALHRYPWNAEARRTVALALHLRRGTEARLGPGLPPGLPRTHPAHLHMNVEAEFRRHGIGAQLIQRFVSELRAAGVPGVHLFCGAGPRAFYLRNGFTELAAGEAFPGRWVYTLGRRLGDPVG